MKNIKQMYRPEYNGEEVVTDLYHDQNKWKATKEWIPNSVINNQISNQACIIGNGISRKDFNINAVINHGGGLLGRKKLQTYGCNALYRDFTPDFLVASGASDGIIAEIANSGYCNNHVVYAAAPHIQNHPGSFYLVPQDPPWNAGSVATYLAAFDGHTTIYLVGFDGQDTPTFNYNVYAGTANYQNASGAQSDPAFLDLAMVEVFNTYPEIDFVRVMPSAMSSMPEDWRYVTNLRQISFRDFVMEADI